MKKIMLLSVFCLLISAIEVSAQATTINYPIPTTTKIGWNHSGLNVVGFKVLVDGQPMDLGAVLRVPVSATNPTLYSAPFPPVTPGNHVLVIRAYNAGGDAPPSNELQVVVNAVVPDAATGLILIIQSSAPK